MIGVVEEMLVFKLDNEDRLFPSDDQRILTPEAV